MKHIYILFILLNSCIKEVDKSNVIFSDKQYMFLSSIKGSTNTDEMYAVTHVFDMSRQEVGLDQERALTLNSTNNNVTNEFNISILNEQGDVLSSGIKPNSLYNYNIFDSEIGQNYIMQLRNDQDTWEYPFTAKKYVDSIKVRKVYVNENCDDIAFCLYTQEDTLRYSTYEPVAGDIDHSGYGFMFNNLNIYQKPNLSGDSIVVYWSELDSKYEVIKNSMSDLEFKKYIENEMTSTQFTFVSEYVASKSLQNIQYAKDAINPFLRPRSFNGNVNLGNLIGDFSVIQVE